MIVPEADVRPVGYYVHHHGQGHAARFRAIAAASRRPLAAISELDVGCDETEWTIPPHRIPSDVPRQIVDPTAGGALHWAPLGSSESVDRLVSVVEWVDRVRPVGMVVDVSVEMAVLARLAGLATIVVRQHGDRDDEPHRIAYRSAERLLAPYPAELEHPRSPDWVVERTDHVGFIASARLPEAVARDADAGHDLPADDDIVVLWGAGGGTLSMRSIGCLAEARPGATVWLLGHFSAELSHARVRAEGFVSDPTRHLARHPTVVASAGNNAVAEAAHHGCALVVVPQDRPFDEQMRHAEALDAREAAAIGPSTDTAASWAHALDIAEQRRHRLSALARQDGAPNAAHAIEQRLAPYARPAPKPHGDRE